jgi:WD40 repeat protein
VHTRSPVLMNLNLVALVALLSSCGGGSLGPFSEEDQKVKGVWSGMTKTKCVSTALAWSPDGSRVLWNKTPYKYVIWNASTGAAEKVLENSVFRANAAWSNDGTKIAGFASKPLGAEIGAKFENEVAVWDASTGALLRSVKVAPQEKILTAVFSGDLNAVAVINGAAINGGVQLFSLTDGSLLRNMGSTASKVLWLRLAFSADGSRLVGFGFSTQGDTNTGLVRAWNVATGEIVRDFTVGDPAISEFDFLNATGTTMFSGSENGSKLFDVATGTAQTLEGNPKAAAILRDGSKVVTINGDFLDTIDLSTGTRAGHIAATNLPDVSQFNTGEFTQIANWLASNGTLASVVSNARISDTERKCELQLRSLTDGALVRTIGAANENPEVKLDLQAQGGTQYTVTGSATVNGKAFSVQGSGVVAPVNVDSMLSGGAPQGIVDFRDTDQVLTTLELRDTNGKPTWKLETTVVTAVRPSGGLGGIVGTQLTGKLKNLIATSDQFDFTFYNKR